MVVTSLAPAHAASAEFSPAIQPRSLSKPPSARPDPSHLKHILSPTPNGHGTRRFDHNYPSMMTFLEVIVSILMALLVFAVCKQAISPSRDTEYEGQEFRVMNMADVMHKDSLERRQQNIAARGVLGRVHYVPETI